MNGDKKSNLLSNCDQIAADIPVCQSLGKTVILSIGGVFSDKSNYTVSSVQGGVEFADFVWHAFGPFDPAFPEPRPFDINGVHVAVDGFDFDIEEHFLDQSGYVAMINRLRQNFGGSDKFLITGAPSAPLEVTLPICRT